MWSLQCTLNFGVDKVVKKILEQEPITLSEVRAILKSEKRKSSELGYVQARAVSHADKFTKISASSATKLVEELIALGMSKDKAVEIANLLPETLEELRALFAKEKTVETEKLQQILDIIAKHR